MPCPQKCLGRQHYRRRNKFVSERCWIRELDGELSGDVYRRWYYKYQSTICTSDGEPDREYWSSDYDQRCSKLSCQEKHSGRGESWAGFCSRGLYGSLRGMACRFQPVKNRQAYYFL